MFAGGSHSSVVKKPVPVLIVAQLVAGAITCTSAGFALATISEIVVAWPPKATLTAKNDSNRL
jgi:hypothetical protein